MTRLPEKRAASQSRVESVRQPALLVYGLPAQIHARAEGARLQRSDAVQQVVDGGNYRRIGRALGVDHQTVANWVKAHSEALPDAPAVPEGELTVNELDEVFTFIGVKKTKSTS